MKQIVNSMPNGNGAVRNYELFNTRECSFEDINQLVENFGGVNNLPETLQRIVELAEGKAGIKFNSNYDISANIVYEIGGDTLRNNLAMLLIAANLYDKNYYEALEWYKYFAERIGIEISEFSNDFGTNIENIYEELLRSNDNKQILQISMLILYGKEFREYAGGFSKTTVNINKKISFVGQIDSDIWIGRLKTALSSLKEESQKDMKDEFQVTKDIARDNLRTIRNIESDLFNRGVISIAA